MRPTLWLRDRWDEPLGTLAPLGDVTHAESLAGEDALELWCREAPAKGSRVLWRDPDDAGRWREHVVSSTEERAPGLVLVRAEGSVCELALDFVEDVPLVSRDAGQALAAALAGTRWEAYAGDAPEARRGCLLYHVDALSAARRVAEVWGGELYPVVDVRENGAVVRRLCLAGRRGGWRGARLSRGAGLASLRRVTEADPVVTALYGFGRGEAVVGEDGLPTGDFTRRLTFAAANGGIPWVGDEAARERWGRWDAGHRRRVHAFGQVTFPGCSDPGRLLAMTREVLRLVCEPRVAYVAEAADVPGGVPVALGDDVAVTDDSRSPAWRQVLRAERRVRRMGVAETRRELVLGTGARPTLGQAADLVARRCGWSGAHVDGAGRGDGGGSGAQR